jgi:ribonucleoside-diphosphate reductase alpha chain
MVSYDPGEEIAVKYWAREGEESYNQIVNRVVNHLYPAPTTMANIKHPLRLLLENKSFMFNSPVFMNAGTELKSLAACFVLPLEDNMESIFNTARDMAMIMKEGGGVGLSLSALRPEGSPVKKTKGVSSGPISFLKVYDSVVDVIKAGGTRRGAALANLRADHPDIMKFISCKSQEGAISNFNISVDLRDKFMNTASEFPYDKFIDGTPAYPVTEAAKTEDRMAHHNSKAVIRRIAEGMWKNGEPGVQFMDTVNRVHDYTHSYAAYNKGIVTSNPCSEAFLAGNESCILGSINLYNFITPFWAEGGPRLDLEALLRCVETAVDVLNRVIDITVSPLPAIDERTKLTRKIGIGIMGLADALSALKIGYGTKEGVLWSSSIMANITIHAEKYSLKKNYKNAMLTLIAPTGTIATVANVSNGIEPHFRLKYNRKTVKAGDITMMARSLQDFFSSLPSHLSDSLLKLLDDNNGKFPPGPPYGSENRPNPGAQYCDLWPTADSITPDQHLDMLAALQKHVHNGISKTINLPNSATVDDIEKLIYKAWKLGVKGFTVYREGSREAEVLSELKTLSKIEDKMLERLYPEGSVPVVIPSVESDLHMLNSTLDIVLKGQNASKEDREQAAKAGRIASQGKAFGLAYGGGVRVTQQGVPSASEQDRCDTHCKSCKCDTSVEHKRDRVQTTFGNTVKAKVGCGNLYITANADSSGPCEVFTNLGRAGGCPSQSEATSRLISLALRSGVPVDEITEQLRGIKCMASLRSKQSGTLPDGTRILSCPDAIGKVLGAFADSQGDSGVSKKSTTKHIQVPNRSEPAVVDEPAELLPAWGNLPSEQLCPECGALLRNAGGCKSCTQCAWRRCG